LVRATKLRYIGTRGECVVYTWRLLAAS